MSKAKRVFTFYFSSKVILNDGTVIIIKPSWVTSRNSLPEAIDRVFRDIDDQFTGYEYEIAELKLTRKERFDRETGEIKDLTKYNKRATKKTKRKGKGK